MRAQLIGNGLLTARIPEPAAAVLEALQLQGAREEALLALDDAGWKSVLRFCDRMQLTLPLALRASRRFPAWVNERLMGNLSDVFRRFARVQATYREAAAVLDLNGIPYLVLKGFTQAPDYVRAPKFRMQSDIDLYTDRDHIPAAVQALEGIGYEPAGPAEVYRLADHVPTLTRYREWVPGSNPFDPEMPLAFDVHHCLWNAAVSLIQLPETEEFWNRRIHRALGELRFPALAPVDHLGYFALHMLREVFAGGRLLHHARELATFLHERAGDGAIWREWQALHSPRLRQVQAIALAMAGAVFSSQLPNAVRDEIERLPTEQQRWIKTCGGNLLTGAPSRNRDGRLLQFLLADSGQARRRILWRAVTPAVVPGPRRVASWPEPAVSPWVGRQRWPWRYPAYLLNRVFFNSGAILRLLASSLAVFLSGFAHRGDATL